MRRMNKNAKDNPVSLGSKKPYSKQEEYAAVSFVKFLYDLWREHLRNEIMELDKNIYENEEPTKVD